MARPDHGAREFLFLMVYMIVVMVMGRRMVIVPVIRLRVWNFVCVLFRSCLRCFSAFTVSMLRTGTSGFERCPRRITVDLCQNRDQ